MKGVVTKRLNLQQNTNSDQLEIATDKFDKMELATTNPLGYLAPTTMRMYLFQQTL